MRSLREDFERWYVTATFEEKASYVLLALLGAGYLTLGVGAILQALQGGGRID